MIIFVCVQYNDGIPEDTRFQKHSEEFNGFIKTLDTPEGKEMILKVKELTKIAQEGKLPSIVCPFPIPHPNLMTFSDLQTTMTALALAWVAKNPNTATVILGASKPEQITQNLEALEVIPKLTPEILHKIDQILSNTPAALVCILSVDDGILTDTL